MPVKVRLVIHFDEENGFDVTANIQKEDAEALTNLFKDAMQRALPGLSKKP